MKKLRPSNSSRTPTRHRGGGVVVLPATRKSWTELAVDVAVDRYMADENAQILDLENEIEKIYADENYAISLVAPSGLPPATSKSFDIWDAKREIFLTQLMIDSDASPFDRPSICPGVPCDCHPRPITTDPGKCQH